ncbi:MAG: 50S ribosomal protein L15 [candidate division Zixibacteria bacterium HGW-Zixibacteria-1]|nr:ribosomal protein L15 [uncultured bacterium]PKK84589.1 MAG: 50S ribosomal protein L15 [candidate division Zixibacteria bacterium HGW-Zixibacteria-1]
MARLELSDMQPAPGAHKKRRRYGRGTGSGRGKTAGRGHKGQKARSGGNIKAWMEGGQMPIQRRIPKRGFTNRFREEYQEVNISALSKCRPGEVTPDTLKELGIIKSTRLPVKILGMGKLETALQVKAAAFSKSAIEKIREAGGNTEVV